MFEATERTLRLVREEEKKLFGGLSALFAADWRQCLPVVPRISRGTIVHARLKSFYMIYIQRQNCYRLESFPFVSYTLQILVHLTLFPPEVEDPPQPLLVPKVDVLAKLLKSAQETITAPTWLFSPASSVSDV